MPDAHEKIAFDKFHVAKYLGDAVDKVRRTEHRALLAEGWDDLTLTKHRWLMNPRNMSPGLWRDFKSLRDSALKTTRSLPTRLRYSLLRTSSRASLRCRMIWNLSKKIQASGCCG